MTFSQIAFWAASTIATSVVKNLVNTAYSKLYDRILPADSIDELERLKTALPQITAVMRIAEALKVKDPNTSGWAEQFRRAVEASEDVLDELEYKTLEDMVKNQDEAGGSTSSSKKRKVSALNDDTLERLKKALTMLDQAVAGVDRLLKLAKTLGISNLSESQQDVGKDLGRETTSIINEREVIGRNVEKDKIISWLKRPSCASLSSFCIVGVGGVGKTTLVQFAYEQMRGSNHFDKIIWICVSTNFSVVDITRKILGELGEGSIDKPLNALQETLKENIRLKKILLILDDIWDDERRGWEQLVAPLGFAQEGSKILFTTRMKSVADLLASVVNTEHESLPLEGLEEQDLQSLFYSHAFNRFDNHSHERLKIFGDQIVKMLRGNPLAAKVIGDLLNSSMEDEHWRRIVNYSSIFNIEGAKDVVEVLKLSYYHLPADLQVCFRFCSIFPQDHEFDKNELIKMWIASGLCPDNRLEDIGEYYFNQLLRKSFFEYSKSCKDERYVMHDLMHELASNVSNGECCRIEPGDKSITIPSTVRHVGVHDSEIERVSHLENLRSLVITTSFGLTVDEPDLFVLPKNMVKKSLRLLKIYLEKHIQLPNEISCLIHLRYLSINRSKGCFGLQWFNCGSLDSVYKLYQLQVLELPELHDEIKDKKIKEDGYTTGMSHLHRLRYIRLPDQIMQVIHGVHKLTSLQELTFFVGQNDGYHIEEINSLNNLRHLSIKKIENIKTPSEAKRANLLGKNNLISLSLGWTSGNNLNNSEQIIDYLQPHPNLMELTIENYKGQRSPSWMEGSQPLYLSSLKLISCPMWKNQLFFAQIPYLKILDICGCLNLDNIPDMPLSLIEFRICNVGLTSLPKCGYQSAGNNTQPQESLKSLLRVVHIEKCPNLIFLNGFLQQDSLDLQAIEKLSIDNCEILVHLPTDGFGNLTSLIDLTLRDCPKLVAMDFQRCHLPTKLQKLNMGNCGKLDLPLLIASSTVTTLVELVLTNANINSITAGQNSFTALERLYIRHCTMLVEISFPEKAHGEYEYNLSVLDISNCPNLTKLPSMPLSVTSFGICNVPLSALPKYGQSSDSRSCPSTSPLELSLIRVAIENCLNLTSLNGFLQQDNIYLLSIKELTITGCNKLVEGSRNQAHHINQGSNLVSLKLSHLEIDKLSLLLIGPLRSARSVSHLDVFGCSSMKAFPEQWLQQNSSSLRDINIYNCAEESIKEYLRAMERSLTALERLEINEESIWIITDDSPGAAQSSYQLFRAGPFFDLDQPSERSCKLQVLRDGNKIEVATGTINLPVIEDGVIRGVPIPSYHARIIVDECLPGEDNTPVPMPNGELVTLRSVLGSYTAWPMTLISLDEEPLKESVPPSGPPMFSSRVYKGFDGINFNKLGVMYKTLRDRFLRQDEYMFHIQVPLDLFNETDPITITANDFSYTCKGNDWLSAPTIKIFMLLAYKFQREYLPEIPIGFMDPERTHGMIWLDGDQNQKNYGDAYIRKALRYNRDKKLIFIPYYQGKHWVLLVLWLLESELYVFDSASRGPVKRNLAIIDALSDLWVVEKATGGIEKSDKLKVIRPKCRQQKHGWECAYYVMLYVNGIINFFLDSFPNMKEFEVTTAYTNAEINSIRNIWVHNLTKKQYKEIVLSIMDPQLTLKKEKTRCAHKKECPTECFFSCDS